MEFIRLTYDDMVTGRSSWRVVTLFSAVSLAITAVCLS
jgi:hypothetical protein